MNTISRRHAQLGLSLIELMIAITIGLLLLAGLATIFANSSSSQNELRRAAAQIENGRFAMDTMTQDLQVAGFWGQYRSITSPASTPDACDVSVTALTEAVNLPVQAYWSGGVTSKPSVPASCSTWLPASNLAAGSDVIVIRRAETAYVGIGTTTVAGERYVQANPATISVQNGGGTTSCTTDAAGAATSITRRCLTPTTHADEICSGSCPGGSPSGYIRKLRVHIYFVAPCNVPAGGATTCGADADGGRPVPTLKRLELIASGGSATFQIVPIAEGVEFMTIGYGIDDTPTSVNAETGLIGDGAPDRYVLNPNLTQMSNAVTVRLDLLVRNPEPSLNYTDNKSYGLGSDPSTPTSAAVTVTSANYSPSYRRHVYNSEIRLVNLSSRKENP
jgi:type IV pilus assembly protein PilW